jgi:DNA-binding transcriptional LysR family regulator
MPRGYVLTPGGELLSSRIQPLEEAIFGIERLKGTGDPPVEGRVRISAPPVLASLWLVPRLAVLRETYPGLVLDIVGQSSFASLARREADLALRLSRPDAEGLVARHVGSIRYGIYGARSYVEATADGDRVFLGYNEELEDSPQQRWTLRVAGQRSFVMLTNDLGSLLSAVRAGWGLAAIPHALVNEDPELVCVETGEDATRELWLVVHPDVGRANRIRVVMNHLVRITACLRG